jgi:hypothetical protein
MKGGSITKILLVRHLADSTRGFSSFAPCSLLSVLID